MALNIKNAEVEQLATEVAKLAHESKTEAIRKALQDRKAKLTDNSERNRRIDQVIKELREEFWPTLTPEQRRPLTKEEEEEILGIGPDGY
ncbi:MAG: type II toxin-antitoxin system VapB family antitoxin [Fimbriimonadaceae bacterium]